MQVTEPAIRHWLGTLSDAAPPPAKVYKSTSDSGTDRVYEREFLKYYLEVKKELDLVKAYLAKDKVKSKLSPQSNAAASARASFNCSNEQGSKAPHLHLGKFAGSLLGTTWSASVTLTDQSPHNYRVLQGRDYKSLANPS